MSRCWPLLAVALLAAPAFADPCGMVPPIYTGKGVPLTRVGEQMTYVFYKDGVETFVIKPGFEGKVDEFGMLIPFPAAPAIRKVPDEIFEHIAAAIDPPEIVVEFYPPAPQAPSGGGGGGGGDGDFGFHSVNVVRQEAVGMYEVAVLEAGSAAALKKWIDDHGYKYPRGMDAACEDYVEAGWCFVAVKTKVGAKQGVVPRPGLRKVDSRLPSGATFDGQVQAMGFRFQSDELVVPMRLSAFNAGELRNTVYLLTDGPRKIRSIPEEYVVRQIDGRQLIRNLTHSLAVRILGGKEKDLPARIRKELPKRRDPATRSGAARNLFAADLLAAGSGRLDLPQDQREKELLVLSERLGLRGADIDQLHADSLADERAKTVSAALKSLTEMTLTVVDGDFPREVLSKQNLTFGKYEMPEKRNNRSAYDAHFKMSHAEKKNLDADVAP